MSSIRFKPRQVLLRRTMAGFRFPELLGKPDGVSSKAETRRDLIISVATNLFTIFAFS